MATKHSSARSQQGGVASLAAGTLSEEGQVFCRICASAICLCCFILSAPALAGSLPNDCFASLNGGPDPQVRGAQPVYETNLNTWLIRLCVVSNAGELQDIKTTAYLFAKDTGEFIGQSLDEKKLVPPNSGQSDPKIIAPMQPGVLVTPGYAKLSTLWLTVMVEYAWTECTSASATNCTSGDSYIMLPLNAEGEVTGSVRHRHQHKHRRG